MAIEYKGGTRATCVKSDIISDSLGSSADGTNSGITLSDGYIKQSIGSHTGNNGGNYYRAGYRALGSTLNTNWVFRFRYKPTALNSNSGNRDGDGMGIFITDRAYEDNVNDGSVGTTKAIGYAFRSKDSNTTWYYNAYAGTSSSSDSGVMHHSGGQTDFSDQATVDEEYYVEIIKNGTTVTVTQRSGSHSASATETETLTTSLSGFTHINIISFDGNGSTQPVITAEIRDIELWDNTTSASGTATWSGISDFTHQTGTTGHDYKLGTGAYSFDGSNDTVNLGNDLDTILTGDFSFTTWAYMPNATSSSNKTIICKPATTSWANPYHSFTIQHTGGNIDFQTNNGSTNVNIDLACGQGWHHIAVTKSGTTFTLYIDGTTSESQTISGTAWGTQDWIIGNTPYNSRYFDGDVDDMSFWSRALTATEIGKLASNNVTKLSLTSENGNSYVRTGAATIYGEQIQAGNPLIGQKLNNIVMKVSKSSGTNSGTIKVGIWNTSSGTTAKHTFWTGAGSGFVQESTPTNEVTFGLNGTTSIGGTHTTTESGVIAENDVIGIEATGSNIDYVYFRKTSAQGDSTSKLVEYQGSWSSGNYGTAWIKCNNGTPTAQAISALTDKSELKAYYSMDSEGVSGSPTWTEDFTQNLASDYDSSEESNNQWQKFNASTDRLEFSHQQNGTWSAMTRDITSSTGMNTTLNTSKWTCRFKINLSEWYGADNRWSEVIVLLTSYSRTDPTTNNKYNSAITGFNGLGLKFFNKNTGAEARAFYNDNGSYNDDSGSAYNTTSDNVEGQYYCELSRDGADINVKLWSGSYNGTLRINKTFTVGTDWANGTGGAIKYFGVWSGEDSNGNSNYAVAGHIDELKVYNGTGTTGDCPNDHSATSPAADLVNGFIMESTSDGKHYMWNSTTSTWTEIA